MIKTTKRLKGGERQRTVATHYTANTRHDTLQERLGIYFMQGPVIDI